MESYEIESAPLRLPINLGLNDGTICPRACIDLMRSHTARDALRHYATPENAPLLDVIAAVDQVGPRNVYLAYGSGPLISQCVPHLIKDRALRTSLKSRWLKNKAFPIMTAELGYEKVLDKAREQELAVEALPLGPETDFRLRMADVEGALRRHDGLLYIANPNNPTGQLMLERDEIAYLADRFPRSLLWVDEAYCQYMDPGEYPSVADLVPSRSNLLVSRSFSFAYGLAGVRLGYVLANESLVSKLRSQVAEHHLGTLHESIAIAALSDPYHLPQVREMTARHRAQVSACLREFPGIEVFDSQTHFLLGRFTDGRSGAWLADELKRRGIIIKTIAPSPARRFDEYFRITLGLANENFVLCAKLREILACSTVPAARQASPSVALQPAM